MNAGIGGSQDLPPLMHGPALPVGHHSARGLDHGDRRLHIIGLQTRLDHQINLARRDQGIGIAIHAIAHQPCLGGHPVKGGAFLRRAHFGKCCEQNRLAKRPRWPASQCLGAHRAHHLRAAKSALEPLADIGLINDPVNRPGGIRHGNQHAPGWRARQIAARAINRVQHPCQARRAGLCAEFFAEHRIIRPATRQNATHPGLGKPVRYCDRIKAVVLLGISGQIGRAKMRKRRDAGGIGQFCRRLDKIGLLCRR